MNTQQKPTNFKQPQNIFVHVAFFTALILFVFLFTSCAYFFSSGVSHIARWAWDSDEMYYDDHEEFDHENYTYENMPPHEESRRTFCWGDSSLGRWGNKSWDNKWNNKWDNRWHGDFSIRWRTRLYDRLRTWWDNR